MSLEVVVAFGCWRVLEMVGKVDRLPLVATLLLLFVRLVAVEDGMAAVLVLVGAWW